MSRAKPRALKELSGNPGQGPLKGAPAGTLEKPHMPRGLEKAEQRIWRWVVAAAESSGVQLGRADELLLMDLARCWVRIETLEAVIAKEGHTVEGARRGTSIKHPLYTVVSTLRTSLKGYFGLLGLSPATREQMSLRLPGNQGVNFDALLK